MKTLITAGALFLGLISNATAQTLSGVWDATLTVSPEYSLPFPIEFTASGNQVTASFFNGDERVTSTSGTLDGTKLTVEFADYDSKIDATLENGVLKGQYGGSRGQPHAFEAHPHSDLAQAEGGPAISGNWTVPHDSPKGEKAWHLIVRQQGDIVSAAILRVDGDTGTLRGSWQKDRYILNIFDGARGATLEVFPRADGSLALNLKGLHGPASSLTAVRDNVAIAQGLPKPTDPEQQTRLKNPAEPLRFNFPDLDGNLVSNTDDRFKNKVVIVSITGSWCPNCHDEAPFLAELFKKYHSKGLEIVALDFEDPAQQKKLTRVRAFTKKFGLDYTYLIAGEPKELQAKLPQAEGLNSFPTTFFIGRDGLVKAVHAGFAAPASGEFNNETVKGITDTVEALLAQSATPPVTASN